MTVFPVGTIVKYVGPGPFLYTGQPLEVIGHFDDGDVVVNDSSGESWTFGTDEVESVHSLPEPVMHPSSARFHDLLAEAGRLHNRKQSDYGKADDPFANVRASSEWGMPAWVGAMVRATDKVRRLQTFALRGELANESVEDAFMDLAVYAIIARILYEQERGVSG